MSDQPKKLNPEQILQELAKLFMVEAHDRQVYCIYGPYNLLRPLQKRIKDETARGGFNMTKGNVKYISLIGDLFSHLKELGKCEEAAKLADRRRDEQLKSILSDVFRDLITRQIEAPDTLGLFLADFEMLYAYDLGGHDISIVRQVAINGKKVCLLVPGVWRDGRLWIFDEDNESRREFPETLLFGKSGWVFEIAGN